MTKAEAFLKQARSDFETFELLLETDRDLIAECQPLLHLQMATEKISKAAIYTSGLSDDHMSHVAFRILLQILKRRDVAKALGYTNFQNYKAFLERRHDWFIQIERLSPSVQDGSNVEYPWEARNEEGQLIRRAPVDYDFTILHSLRNSSDGVEMLKLPRSLFERLKLYSNDPLLAEERQLQALFN